MKTITILATGLAQGRISNGMATIYKRIAKGDSKANIKICSWRQDMREVLIYIGSKWTDDSQIILGGHSWGVWFLVQLCVKLGVDSIPVRLLASADGVNRPLNLPLVIPRNVTEVQSWFQTKGIIKGSHIQVSALLTKYTVYQQVKVRHFKVDETPAFQDTIVKHALGEIL